MPYKTRFREVKTPKSAADMRAIGTDANSLRSMGAAMYRQLSTAYPSSMPRIADVFFAAYEKIAGFISDRLARLK